jgi:DNA-binding transcriptional LysR family regulator
MADSDPRLVAVLPEKRILRSFWFVTHQDIRKLPRVVAFRQWLDETALRMEGILKP